MKMTDTIGKDKITRYCRSSSREKEENREKKEKKTRKQVNGKNDRKWITEKWRDERRGKKCCQVSVRGAISSAIDVREKQ